MEPSLLNARPECTRACGTGNARTSRFSTTSRIKTSCVSDGWFERVPGLAR